MTIYYNGTTGNDVFKAFPTAIYNTFDSWSINGYAGNDTLTGGELTDTISGGDGNDLFLWSAGADILDGGNGSDTANYSSYLSNQYTGSSWIQGIAANLATGIVSFPGTFVTVQTLSNVENLTGSGASDAITGNFANNVLNGGSGDDSLFGDVGDDQLIAGAGNDWLDGGYGFDLIDGGSGIDTTTYEFYRGGINADLTTGVVSFPGNATLTDTLRGIENLIAAQGNDVVNGSSANNFLSGLAGDDQISAGAGNDVLSGGTGNDLLNGGTGSDTFFVDSTGDVVVEALSSGTDLVNSSVNYALTDNVENLSLTGTAMIGQGNNLNNTITANVSDNIIFSGNGQDAINSGLGSDYIFGDAGNDTLKGYGGGYEVDALSGGAGADKFILGDSTSVFYTYPGLASGNYDYGVIVDFKASEGDKIQLKGNAGNYLLGIDTDGGFGTIAAETLIYQNTGNTGSGNLVGIIQDVSNLSLTGSYFTYV